MDLHRIPDDLSIPEFLRRKPRLKERKNRRLPTAAEADEMSGRAFAEAFREINEEERKKRRLPTDAEMREVADRAFLKATREFNEENREIIEARSRHPPTDAEIDEIFAEGMAEALEEVRAKAPPAPTPEEAAKDPACVWRWIDESCHYYCKEALREGARRIEKYHRAKIIGLVKERAWTLATRTCAPGNA
jgi:hypothetical protein